MCTEETLLGEWIKKTWYTIQQNILLPQKKKERKKKENPLICEHERHLLSKINQSQGTNTARFHLHEASKTVKLIEAENISYCQGLERVKNNCCSLGLKF